MKNAIVLCSGGMDSVVATHYVKKKLNYDKIIILFFNYRQRTLNQERKFAKLCAKELGGEFREIKLPELAELSTSLLNKKGKHKEVKNLKNTKKENKKWYVPCRNTVFLSYALAFAESEYIKKKITNDIFVGFKCEGKEPYPDTTPQFVKKINELSKILCREHFRIKTPLIKKDKEDIILLGKKLGVDFSKTFSCYVGKGKKHCGTCLACRLRQKGFYWADVKDNTEYA